MKVEDLKLKIFQDNYITIAVEEYLKFKDSDYYDEEYKWRCLQDINAYMKGRRITAENILDIIAYFQQTNPSNGSLIRWSYLEDLKGYAESRPVEVAELLNHLYEDSLDIEDRIKRFYDMGKAYDRKIRLGTPLFSFLLAAYDLKKYPLYREDVFIRFLKSCDVNYTLGSIPTKYSNYYSLCNILLEYFQQNGLMDNPHILDVQDFLFCITKYDPLYIKIAIRYIYQHADVINPFIADDNLFIDYINNLDRGFIDRIYNQYQGDEKVNYIRFKIAENLMAGKTMDINKLEAIKEEALEKFGDQILKQWNNFRILFPFYYLQYRNKVDIELRKIYDHVRNIKEFKGYKFKENKYISDFYGPHNYGNPIAWFVLYPESKENHRKSAQLYFAIGYNEAFDFNQISYGLSYGFSLESSQILERDLEAVASVEDFDLKRMEEKYIEVFQKFKEFNHEYEEVIDNSLATIKENEKEIPGTISLDVDFERDLQIDKLYFENKETIINQISTAIKSGKHIILIGPPGTGKSKLARDICENYRVPYQMVTAMSDWSSYDTIGGYKPREDGSLYFDEGVFLQCFKDRANNEPINKWLIIDEINRADIDKAFGSLFSALTGDEITLSFKSNSQENIVLRWEKEEGELDFTDYEYIIARDWRIIGTMNTFDKASLYEMSYAFMRRFAFIPIAAPEIIDESLLDRYFKIWGIEDRSINNVNLKEGLAKVWKIINKYRVIGPAIIEDMARYISVQGDYTSALILYVLPQFEGLMANDIVKFTEELYKTDIDNLTEGKKMLNSFIRDFFGIKIS